MPKNDLTDYSRELIKNTLKDCGNVFLVLDELKKNDINKINEIIKDHHITSYIVNSDDSKINEYVKVTPEDPTKTIIVRIGSNVTQSEINNLKQLPFPFISNDIYTFKRKPEYNINSNSLLILNLKNN